jgi:ATP-dependent Clp protease ATP-binding subunit ClpC
MTSNIGHKEKSKRSLGFVPSEEDESDIYKQSLKKYLRPELLARIDEVLFFNNLGDSHLLKIINQELKQIGSRLKDKNISIKWNSSVKKYIFNEIKEKNSHARDIKNTVKTLIQVPLSQFIVKNRKTEQISIKIVDKSLSFV